MAEKKKETKPTLGLAIFQAFKQIEALGKPTMAEAKKLVTEAKGLSPKDRKWYATKLKEEFDIEISDVEL